MKIATIGDTSLFGPFTMRSCTFPSLLMGIVST